MNTTRFPQTVIALGVVSFLTDLSSEMIYPLLPIFLTTVLGAGAVMLGLIEGIAESTAALVKVASGIWTDRTQKRKALIVAGYSLSGVMRPLIGLATAWPTVLVLRFADRVGKGIRSSPRDALIAYVTEAGARGAAYGFHRAMDHAGAVAGPLVAVAQLNLGGFSLREVFLLAALPAAVVLFVLLAGVKEPDVPREEPEKVLRLQVFIHTGFQYLFAGSRGLIGVSGHPFQNGFLNVETPMADALGGLTFEAGFAVSSSPRGGAFLGGEGCGTGGGEFTAADAHRGPWPARLFSVTN